MFCCLGGKGGRKILKGTRGFQGGVEGGPIAANRTVREDYRKLTANELPIRGGGRGGGVMRIFLGSSKFLTDTTKILQLPPPSPHAIDDRSLSFAYHACLRSDL